MNKSEKRSEKKSENHEVLRGARVVGIFIMASRLLGYVRDAILAYFFGAQALMDVFVVAFRIPNTFRRLFAEGSLTIAFVPVFTERLKNKSSSSNEEARNLFDTVFTVLTILLTLLSILGVVFAPQVVWLFAGGFQADPPKFQMAVQATRIVFPYILLISLVAAAMGVLNSLRHFSAPAAAGMVLNISIILGVIFLPSITPWSQLQCVCVAIIIGGILQLALQLPFLKQKGFFPRPRLHLKDPSVKRIFHLMGPAIFGSAVYQLNILLMTRFASELPEGSNAFLYYADRIFQLPLALFGISVATSALPALSRLASERNREGFANTFSFSMRAILFIVLPATAGMIALRVGIIQTLFQSGKFAWEHTLETAHALLYFSLGLASVALVRVTVAAFNAHQNTKTPVKIAVIALLSNVLFCFLLMKPLGHSGLALSVTLASTINFCLLAFILNRRYGVFEGEGGRKVFKAAIRIGLLSLAMGILVAGLAGLIPWEEGARSLQKVIYLFGLIALGIGFYLLSAKLLRFPEFEDFFKKH